MHRAGVQTVVTQEEEAGCATCLRSLLHRYGKHPRTMESFILLRMLVLSLVTLTTTNSLAFQL